MKKLLALLNNLETKIPYNEKLNTAVSASSVGWHIQHTVLAAHKMIAAVEQSNPENYRWTFNLKRTLVFTLNKIPRGKGKAPKSVLPTEAFNPDSLLSDIQLLKEKIHTLDSLPANHFFNHPYFGSLNVKGTQKILELHTRHHIDIINEIIN